MKPLALAAVGILVVAIDLNLESVDLLLDPVGYAMVALGVFRLAHVHEGFARARWAALVGLVASLFTMVLREAVTTTTGDPGGVTVTSSQIVEPALPTLVESLSQAAFVFFVCTALVAVARDPRVVAPASTLRVALPVTALVSELLGLVLWAVGWSGAQGDAATTTVGVVGLLALGVGIVGLVLAIWFFFVLLRASREPALQADRGAAMIPG